MTNIITRKIDNKDYQVLYNEFEPIKHEAFNNLILYKNLANIERHIGLINDLTEAIPNLIQLDIFGDEYGAFLPINLKHNFEMIRIFTNIKKEHIDYNLDMAKNIEYNNISFLDNKSISSPDIVYVFDNTLITDEMVKDMAIFPPILITKEDSRFDSFYEYKYKLSNIDFYTTEKWSIYIPKRFYNHFYSNFSYYLKDSNILSYDNLINLCIMVKDAGPLFEKVLTDNLDIIDRWTFLDTGSTDGTIDVINKVLESKKGRLYREPFKNFRDSRNKCLELAGKSCKYNVMLDDTYIVQGDFRKFLEEIRSDQFATSYSLIMKSDDTEYYSNRVTKSDANLRYIYKIHEVIQQENNVNVVIPNLICWIFDMRADYMEKRTMDRKLYDLKLLFEEVEDEPDNPRHLYYIAQTYNLLEDHEKSAEYFRKRADHPNEGFKQEKVDALFELARTMNFKLNKPWEECEKVYKECFELEPTRPDALYFIGIHYYLQGKYDIAYPYMKKAFEVGYPVDTQFSLKPTLSYYFLPKFLAHLCYLVQDYKLGSECCKLFLSKNNDKADEWKTMVSWYEIFTALNQMPLVSTNPLIPDKPIICFVADGGFTSWTGRDILTRGVGGSETYIIEMARYFSKNSDGRIIVFCRCDKMDIFENVEYIPINEFYRFISVHEVNTCIVSRFSHYVPVAIAGHAKNIHLVLHDIGPTGNIIPVHPKLKNIFCLTEWHKQFFLSQFPQFQNITKAFHYGIDMNTFGNVAENEKVRHSFIYSSFPNRGLIILLKMWPEIKKIWSDATLNIYSDVYGKWTNDNFPDEMKEIQNILFEDYKDDDSINYYGWVSKKILADAWKKSDVWFYPCKFAETFCLTALEAATTKTLCITNHLAALQDTVGDRGLVVKGDATTMEWQEEVLRRLRELNDQEKNELVEKNYSWALEHTWEKQAVKFLNEYIIESNNIKNIDEKLNYLDMYNWTNDLPNNTRHIFENVLNMFKDYREIDILEIGTYTGTSVIEMLKILPNATASVIDRWEDYDEENDGKKIGILKAIKENDAEKVFYSNLAVYDMEGRVSAYKGSSIDSLMRMVRDYKLFDFIYVDASHKCLDCFVDMVLSWPLLKRGGVLGVDDYLYNMSSKDVLDSPYQGVNRFLELYDKEYEIIHKGYRVFLKKL